MIKRIVVPLDGSRLAEMALPHAIAVARAKSYGITLLQVAPHPVYENPLTWSFAPSAGVFEGWEEEIKSESEYLQAVGAYLRKEGLNIEVKLLEDDPATGLVTYAGHHPEIALIVMSTHGRSGLTRWIFGSVAEKVLHASPVPLMLIRPAASDRLSETISVPAYRSIVVPLDGSPLAEQALEQATTLAKSFDATLTLVSAVPETPIYGEVIAPPAIPVAWEDETEQVTAYLDRTTTRLQAQGYIVNPRLEYGPPADAILRVAEKTHADLIVMATHGRSGLPRLWLGSIAMKVVQASSRPVLLVRATQLARQPEEVAEAKETVAI
jgi:nucleotide-binding universal stress UspA family protein